MTEEPKTMRVIDTSATAECPVREHDIFVGGELRRITFEYGKETFLPEEIAMKFMNDGFIVIDGEKTVDVPKASDLFKAHLKPNEVIATYEELKLSALKTRAASRIGGERFLTDKKAAEAEIIAFLLDAPVVDDDEEDEIVIDMSEIISTETDPDTNSENIEQNATEPADKTALFLKIIEAVTDFDMEDDALWDEDGAPLPEAVSKALSLTVTAEDIDLATEGFKRDVNPPSEAETKENSEEKPAKKSKK